MTLPRIGIALTLAFLFGLAFYGFVLWMPAVEEEWRIANKELVRWEVLFLHASHLFGKYWYLPAFGTLVAILLVLFVPLRSPPSGE